MTSANKYIVLCAEAIKAPDNKYYAAVWGKVTRVKTGIKVGFRNDFVIINEAYIVSQALCNVKPTPLDTSNDFDEDDDLDFITEDIYVCIEDKASNADVINKLNKSKVKKRGSK